MKKNHIILFHCFVLILCISACQRLVDGGEYIENTGTELYIESVLYNGENPTVRVKSAESAYFGIDPEILTDEKVEVSIGRSDGPGIALDYDFEKKIFTTNHFVAQQGEDYRLNVEYLNNPEIKSAFAKVVLPFKENFSKLEFVKDLKYIKNQGFFNYVYDVSITFNDELNGDYFLVLPVSRFVDIDGSEDTWTGIYDPYTINKLYDAPQGIRITNDSYGLLVDFEDNQERSIDFNISIDGFEYNFNGNRAQDHVYFQLLSITQDYYKYLKSGGGSPTPSSTIIEPIIEYSNIDKGMGIFGGATMVIDSVAIQ